MLLDLHHDFADAKGDFVREFGAVAMPKEQKPNTTAAAKEAVARVPDNPNLKTQEEFNVWKDAYLRQALDDANNARTDFGAELLAIRKQSDANMMTVTRERSRAFLSQHPAFR